MRTKLLLHADETEGNSKLEEINPLYKDVSDPELWIEAALSVELIVVHWSVADHFRS
jgi:hypothetical protein